VEHICRAGTRERRKHVSPYSQFIVGWPSGNMVKGRSIIIVIIIIIIIGATETISEAFRKYVRNIPGHHEVKELQKTHILRKVLT
jgi:hypothetical protein